MACSQQAERLLGTNGRFSLAFFTICVKLFLVFLAI